MARVRPREGDWFAVPLLDGRWAVGVVARANPKGVLFGYFFGPGRTTAPDIDELRSLTASDAVLAGIFGYLGLKDGRWPLLGPLGQWDRSIWPMAALIRYEELTGRSFRVLYDDNDPNKVLREELVSPGMSEQGPRDGLMGAGFVEKMLTNLLSDS